MNEWYSIAKLVDMQLPGLPGTARGIYKKAKRENWLSRPRQAVGGGDEYHHSSLPDAARNELVQRAQPPLPALPLPVPKPPAVIDETVKAAGDARAATLYGKARERFDTKIALLEQFHGLEGSALHAALVAAGQPISRSSVYRWRKFIAQYGLSRLADQRGRHRIGTGIIDTQPQLAAALRALLTEKPHISPKHALEFLHARYSSSADLTLPGLKTVDRWLKNWKTKNHELFTRLSNPDAWKSKYQASFGDASESITRLNEEWQADSSPADLLLKDGRHSLIVLLDVYSRRLLIHVSKTSTAAAIAHLLRRGLTDWGVPERLKTDNGQDYVAAHITRILHALGIDHLRCLPFQPQGKGHVERAIQTYSHDLVELLPGYIGHNVAQRQALREREQFADQLFTKNAKIELPISAADLQAHADRWCATYHATPHSGLNGQRPLEILAAWREPTRCIPDERVLDLLLAPVPGKDGWRTVQKASGLTIVPFEYLAVECALHIKERVRVLYDPEAAERVYVYNDKGAYLFTAECPELTGINRRELAAHAKNRQHQHIQAAAKDARAEARTINVKTAAEDILAHREAQNSRHLVAFPAPTVDYTTPHLDGLAAALIGETALTGPMPLLLPAPSGSGVGGEGESAPTAAQIIALPRRNYDSHQQRIRDIFARHLKFGLEPDLDDLYILHEFYETREYAGSVARFDQTLRDTHLKVDIAALKTRWLTQPLPEFAALHQETG